MEKGIERDNGTEQSIVTEDTITEEVSEISLRERIFGERVYRAFDPCKWFMYIFLRFPLKSKKTPNGGFLFYYDNKSFISIGFLITSSLMSTITLLCCINTIGSIVDFPQIQPQTTEMSVKKRDWGNVRFEEKYLIRRNVIAIIILITCLCHTTISSWQFYSMREFASKYFTFWTEAVEIMRIDAASGVRKYMTIIFVSYGVYLFLFLVLCLMRFAPVASGGPAVFTMLSLRCFYPEIHTTDNFWIARGIWGVLFFYTLICSKVFMLLFVLVCRLLKNAFVVWNHRLERVLHEGEGDDTQTDKLRTYDNLFKDHTTLLDLMEGCDGLFSNIIESYYASQVISIVFEVYYFYRSQASPEEFRGARRLDGVIITMYLIHTLALLLVISIAAAEVGEEAMEGLEVLRRKTLMGKKKDDELYFMLSMYTSYTGHFETALGGGGYFTLDKGFLVAIVGTVFSYFIILIQFSPSLIISEAISSLVRHYNTSRLLNRAEGTYGYFPNMKTGLLIMSDFASDWDNKTTI